MSMSESPREQTATDAVRASVAVVEGAIELARAEAKLALLQARTSVTSAFVVLLCVITAVSFLELTLILIAISPLYAALDAGPSSRPLLISLGISVGLVVASGLVARAAWHRMDPRKHSKPSSPPEPSPR
jgi:hypothetical protein